MLRMQGVVIAAAIVTLAGPALAAFDVHNSAEADVRHRINQDTDRKRGVAEGRESAEEVARPQAPTTWAEDVRTTHLSSPADSELQRAPSTDRRGDFLRQLGQTEPRRPAEELSSASLVAPRSATGEVPEGLRDVVPSPSRARSAGGGAGRHAIGLAPFPIVIMGLATAVLLGIIIAGVRRRGCTGQQDESPRQASQQHSNE